MKFSGRKEWQPVIEKVRRYGQDQVFRFWDQLDEQQKQALINQLQEVDFDLMTRLIDKAGSAESEEQDYGRIETAEFITLNERESGDDRVRPLGETALREGRVAAFLVAGGQGTRLGYDGPKGAYPVTPVHQKSLFQWHAEKLLSAGRTYARDIPWYIMTSRTNHEQTLSFFRDHDHFGYRPKDMMFFSQDMIPAIDRKGKFILDRKDHIFMNPNGHGGSLKALWSSGAIEDMQKRKISHIFYFQVDNVLTRICDPVYIGYHIEQGSEMSNKVIRKKTPEEKMGILAMIDGNLGVVEYSDLRDEDRYARNPDGSLKFWAGSIATHVLEVDFVIRENEDGFNLPYHIARKSIPYIDEQGQEVQPEEKNGIKFETFVFDALLDTQHSVSVEVERRREFSPLKNSEGENSPHTVKRDLSNLFGAWLEKKGYQVPRNPEGDAIPKIEVSPLFAIEADEFLKKDTKFVPGEEAYSF